MIQKLKQFFKRLLCPHREWKVVKWARPVYSMDTWKCKNCGIERAYRFDQGPKQNYAAFQM